MLCIDGYAEVVGKLQSQDRPGDNAYSMRYYAVLAIIRPSLFYVFQILLKSDVPIQLTVR